MTINDTYELGVRLLKACYGGDQAEMESLLRQGANPNFRIPDCEKNPLNPNWKGSQHLDFYLTLVRGRSVRVRAPVSAHPALFPTPQEHTVWANGWVMR